jgi:hypothetical protein
VKNKKEQNSKKNFIKSFYYVEIRHIMNPYNELSSVVTGVKYFHKIGVEIYNDNFFYFQEIEY